MCPWRTPPFGISLWRLRSRERADVEAERLTPSTRREVPGNPAADQDTSCSPSVLIMLCHRVIRLSCGLFKASSIASVTSNLSFGLTMSSCVSCWAAPANLDRIGTPG